MSFHAVLDATDISSLEALVRQDGPGALCERLGQAAAALAGSDPRRQRLELLRQALILDLAFLRRHPSSLFQCLYNRCTWHQPPASERDVGLGRLAQRWRTRPPSSRAGRAWLRSLRPPIEPLGTGRLAVLHLARGVRPHTFSIRPDGATLLLGWMRWHQRHVAYTASQWDWTTGEQQDVSSSDWPDRAVSPDGRWRLEHRDFGELTLCATADAAGRQPVEVPASCRILQAIFSDDGRWIAAHGWQDDGEGLLHVWQLSRGESSGLPLRLECVLRQRWPWPLGSIGFSPSADRLLLGVGSSAEVLEVGTWRSQCVLGAHAGAVTAVAASPDGRRVACVDSSGRVTLWDPAAAQPTDLRATVSPEGGMLAFSPNGRRLYGQPVLYDGDCGHVVARLDDEPGGYLEGGPPRASHFVGDERIVSLDGPVRVWDAASGAALSGHEEPRFFAHGSLVAFAPDGRSLAIAGPTGDAVVLRQVDTAAVLQQLAAPSVRSLSFSRDGRRLAIGTAAPDGAIRIHDVASGALLRTLLGHVANVDEVVFAVDDRRLVSAGFDEALRVWDTQTGAQLASRPLDSRDPGHQVGVRRDDGSWSETTRRRWAATPEALASLHGWAGFRAPGGDRRFRAVVRDGELAACDAATGQPLAWYPAREPVAAHPSGRIWASRTCHLVLEVDAR